MTEARDVTFRGLAARVSADADGLHCRTLLRRWSVAWSDVADLRIRLQAAKNPPAQDIRRVSVLLRDGRRRRLPLPYSLYHDDSDFDAKFEALRALHRRYGDPESRHVPVVSHRTAGRGWTGLLATCVLLLAGAGVAAWLITGTASQERAWRAAVPCTAETPAGERHECLSTWAAVIARTEVAQSRSESGRLYFTGGRPLERVGVSRDAALTLRPGDRVELTLWRGEVTKVAGDRYVWHQQVPSAGSVAVIAAGFVLAAGYPGALLLLRLRGRRLPDDEVLPSAVPFAFALAGTALWLLPLAYLHPTGLPASPVALTWAVAGSVASLGLFGRAWCATRVRRPGESGPVVEGADAAEEPDAADGVFLAARFLEHTDYNPHRFGTHIALGGGPPAVTPGPGRFAARRIPAERLSVMQVRRARGDDGETFPRNWHVAELDDAGRRVRLAAPPSALARILRELELPLTASPRDER